MATGNWRMIDMPPDFFALWASQQPDVAPPRWYEHPNGLTAAIGREPYGRDYDNPDMRWHISVRYGDPGFNGRVPSWGELVQTAHELRPGVPFVVGIPPRSWWLNVHPDVLHLVETRDLALIASWRDEAQGDPVT
jgi:hypothetical protein